MSGGRVYSLGAFLCAFFLATVANAQPVTVEATDDPGLEQLPILFHHGFNDDGRLWAMAPDGTGTGTPAEYWETLEIRSPQGTLVHRGIPTYVVQYWAQSDAPGFVDGDPNATAEEGWAAFKSPEQIRTPGQNYNSPDPITFFLQNAGQLLAVIPECSFSITGVSCTYPAAEFMVDLQQRMVRSNYNRNGLVEHHAEDLAELLTHVFRTDTRFEGLRQLNVITHSAGGLDTRATLHRLDESADQSVRESIANVVYTAPPFAGSTAAIFAGRLYSEFLDPTFFLDPWVRNGAGDLTLNELLIAVARSFVGPEAEAVMETLLDLIPKPLGLDPTAVTIDQLASDPARATAAVLFVRAMRDLVTGLIGFPGEPKVTQDLTPWGAVENLNRWKPNYHTKQFVTWAEGGGGINLTLSLAQAQAAYDTSGTCCSEFLEPENLQRLADDWALSHVSARVLATELGGIEELARYGSLWHGNITSELDLVGMDWVRALVTPVTALELQGPVPTADSNWRYYRVGPETTIRFVPESRVVEDRLGEQVTIAAQAVEYRLVTTGPGGESTYFPWVTTSPNASVSFAQLAAGEADLSGERPFQMEWRSVNTTGGKEAIRSATFSLDDVPPSITLIDVFTPGIEESPEITGTGTAVAAGAFRRSRLITERLDLPNLPLLLGGQETDWIIRNPANKILRIDFDEPGAVVRYQWDAFFTDPVVQTLPNVSLAFPLAELTPGPHTLYFEVSDQAGNATNAVQAVSVLVDDQPPVVGINYEERGGLGFVVGPQTPIEFVAEDVETGRVTGALTVPGLGDVPVNASFQLGQTSIADAAEGTAVLGLIVTLQAEVADAVGNVAQRSFDVYYDFSPPRIELQHVGNSVLTTNGSYRTTDATVRLEVRVSDNAGYQLPTWTATQPGSEVLRSGAPLTLDSQGGRPLANGTTISLLDGINVVVVTATDLVGNTSSIQLIIEKAQTLIEDESNRPIELLSLHLEGAATGGTGPANVGTSDDGSVFIFDSSRRDHVPDDTNGERDVFVWRNSTLTRANTSADGAQALGGESRSPALSGNGRYAYFASEATNLVPEATSGLNLYVKDLNTGEIALISRRRDGTPVNLSAAFGRLSFMRVCATYTGRYVFFDDRFNDYVEGDTNGNLDVFVADLDPDVDGDLFNSAPVIRRVSVTSDGSEATGGALTGGSRYPSASRDGLFVAYQTDHTNLIAGDDNGTRDVVLTRFGGVDAEGTIDFSSITTIPLARDAQGNVPRWGSEHPTIDRTGRSVAFVSAQNLLQNDTNNEGVDTDVYRSTGFLENWQNRLLELVSIDGAGNTAAGRIAPNHAPALSDYTPEDDPRVAYLADKSSLVGGDLNSAVDLFVHADGVEAINWLGADVPTSQTVLEGGITPDGQYAWWVTIEEYSTVVGVGTGRDLYRRRIDPEAESEAPQIVTAPSNVAALVGEDVAFSVSATGRPLPAYQWSFNGQEIPGAMNPTLFLSDVSFDDAGAYAVVVSNDAGSVTTPAATLSVTSLTPAFKSQPEPVDVTEGETADLVAEVAGLDPLTYQWTRNGIALSDDNRISGAATAALHIASVRLADAGTYVLTATNPGGSVQSDAIALTVRAVTGTEEMAALPTSHALDQNYPNPFNPTTSIRYALPEPARVKLDVFNVLGQRVARLVDDVQPAGWHTVALDAGSWASGAYFYVLSTGSFSQARAFVLAK